MLERLTSDTIPEKSTKKAAKQVASPVKSNPAKRKRKSKMATKNAKAASPVKRARVNNENTGEDNSPITVTVDEEDNDLNVEDEEGQYMLVASCASMLLCVL